MAEKSTEKLTIRLLLAALAGVILGTILAWRRRCRAKPKDQFGEPGFTGIDPELKGLTQEEAAKRWVPVDEGQLTKEDQRRFFRQAVKQNLFTTFNANLFTVAIIMWILDNPWGTLSSVLILGFGICLNVFQEMFTKKRLDQIVANLRPQASVIREGLIQSLSPVRVVADDLLVVGTGDQILVNGRLAGGGPLMVEEMRGNDGYQLVEKYADDELKIGSFCTGGQGVYRASEPGRIHAEGSPGSRLELLLAEMTPIQQMIEIVLRVLFVMVLGLTAYLTIIAIGEDYVLQSPEFQNAVYVVFNLAPTGLFFVLIIQYVMGALRLSQVGALVYRAPTIEALANVSVLCLSQSSLFSGLKVKIEPMEPTAGRPAMAESLIRRILGDIVHSTPPTNKKGRLLAEALPGTAHTPLEMVSLYYKERWSGMTLDEPELRGTFVMGDELVIKPYFTGQKSDLAQTVGRAKRGLGSIWAKLRRKKRVPTGEAIPAAKATPSRKERFIGRIRALLNPIEEQVTGMEETDDKAALTVILAYVPEPVALTDRQGRAQIPKNLVPLARISLRETIRPEARETIQKLIAAGLRVKILAQDAPERIMETAKALGLSLDLLTSTTGKELERLNHKSFSEKVAETTVFGNILPSQQALIIEELKKRGEYVAMVGNDAGDVPAMRKANMGIALKNSTQAALAYTDIILLANSMKALPLVVTTGQRMVNSVLDTLKLNLSQVGLILVMVVLWWLFKLDHFPIYSAQIGVVGIFAVIIPNIILSAWSTAGRLTARDLWDRLIRFIVPAGVTMGILAIGVFDIFWSYLPPADFPLEVLRNLQVADSQVFYAQLGVTWALLFAGWLLIFFLLPPAAFWSGGAPLRGDRRVFGLVAFSVLAFLTVPIVPFFSKSLYMTWLPRTTDYLIVAVTVLIWMMAVKAVWRLNLTAPLSNLLVSMMPGVKRKAIKVPVMENG